MKVTDTQRQGKVKNTSNQPLKAREHPRRDEQKRKKREKEAEKNNFKTTALSKRVLEVGGKRTRKRDGDRRETGA